MAFFENCVERATALAATCGWLAFGGGAEAAVGVAIGGAGLAAVVSDAVRRHGPESEAALKAIRQRISADLIAYAEVERWDTRADLQAADASMERALAGCFLDRKALAASARSSEGFPGAATKLILDRLAEREPATFGKGGATTARDFAELVVRTALEAAIENESYFRSLQPHLLIEMLRGVGDLQESVHTISLSIDELKEQLRRVSDYHERLDIVLSSSSLGQESVRRIESMAITPDPRGKNNAQLLGSAVLSILNKGVSEDKAMELIRHAAGMDGPVYRSPTETEANTFLDERLDGFLAENLSIFLSVNIEAAVLERDHELIEPLAKRGADLNTTDVPYGSLAGLLVCESEDHEINEVKRTLRALLKAGYNPNLRDYHGMNLLFDTSYLDFRAPLTELAIDYGANVNHRANDGETPLMTAARFHETVNSTILLENGANPNLIDDSGDSAMTCAIEIERWAGPVESDNIEADIINYLKLLFSFGASLPTIDGARDPLKIAAEEGLEEVVAFLNSMTGETQ